MKISREAWVLKEECFGPLLPYVKDQQVTDINYNGTDVWIEHLKYGIRKAPVNLTPEFAGRFSVLISNIVSEQINKFNNVLEAETDTLRISIIHPSVTNTGYSISIRKTPAVMRMTEEKMLADGYCSREVLLFLRNCMEAKLNMVFCGCPGAGKTELLKFLTQFIPKHEKVMTIEDNLEIHYRDINPGANCVELKVDEEFFSYTKAIKSALRQNPQWVLLSEARSTEVKYLLECFSTGLHGLTTLHTDDTRKIPDRIQNMMQDSYAASRMENPEWLMNLSLQLQTDNVHVSLKKTIPDAPFILKQDLTRLVEEIEQQPNALQPYLRFMREFQIPDVLSAMKILYSMAEFGIGDMGGQIDALVQRNTVMMDRAERLKEEDMMAGVGFLVLLPMITGVVKMLADLVLVILGILSVVNTI